MRDEQLLSVGIDVGTSTTQCVFSLLTLSNTASSFSVPRFRITKKKILYRSPVALTPLINADTIDADKLEHMIRRNYQDAGVSPADIRLGAVIITGETARKANARSVTQALSHLAGDFVVATAGPSLESILAGRGSGAAEASEKGKRVLNLDIGGGTTNMALFASGDPVADGCLDIGGRLLRFREDRRTVLQFSPAMQRIARDVGMTLREGSVLSAAEIETLANRMTRVLEEAAGLRERTPLFSELTVEHALPDHTEADLFSFSGGVADCIYGTARDDAGFFDIGQVLGRSIASSLFFTQKRVIRPSETSHATVIGAGAYSVAVSGSTIQFKNMHLPLPSLPVAKVSFSAESDLASLGEAVRDQYRIFDGECALYMDGIASPSWGLICRAAGILAQAMLPFEPKVLILKEDMAKALGQALSREWPNDTPFLCLDGIELMYGDTVDIGSPLGGGRVVPVVVKTFAFSQDAGRN